MENNEDLIAASSTPTILALLTEEDSYGYTIITRVREVSGGRIAWADGMLYPVLHRLERLGHIEGRWEVAAGGRRRKYYSITPRGRDQAAEGGTRSKIGKRRERDGGATVLWHVPLVARWPRAA